MKLSRKWAMPSPNTFEIPAIREFMAPYLADARIGIDPFARNSSLATHTNDLNPNTNAQHHLSAVDFLKMLRDDGIVADLIFFDPPYSLRQVAECYSHIGRPVSERDTATWGHWTQEKELMVDLLAPGGVVLSFGWNSNGIGGVRGFQIEEILMVAHGMAHHDTLCVAEHLHQSRLLHKPMLAPAKLGNDRFAR